METRLRFTFTGDLAAAGEYLAAARPADASVQYHLEPLLQELTNTDILVVNFEGPIGCDGPPRTGVSSRLYNEPAVLDWLKKFPVAVCCLANNHMMDYGAHALAQTKEMLQSNGIHCVGAGKDQSEASIPLIITVNGLKVGFINLTSAEPHVGSVLATADSAGSAAIPDHEACCKQVNALANNVDIAVVVLHWGFEYHRYPSPDQVDLCRKLAGAGAALVIGHHPHVIQGLEKHGQSLIAYSLGNLLLAPLRTSDGRPQYRKPATRNYTLLHATMADSALAQWEVAGGKWDRRYRLIPYSEKSKIAHREQVSLLSEALSRPDYEAFWREYRRARLAELEREALKDLWGKFAMMDLTTLLKSFSRADIKRSVSRIVSVAKRKLRQS